MWKKFESSRKKSGNDASYQEHTKGHGGQSKKKDMLRGWLADGAKCSKHYRSAMTTVSHAQTREVQIAWLTWGHQAQEEGRVSQIKEGLPQVQEKPNRFQVHGVL